MKKEDVAVRRAIKFFGAGVVAVVLLVIVFMVVVIDMFWVSPPESAIIRSPWTLAAMSVLSLAAFALCVASISWLRKR